VYLIDEVHMLSNHSFNALLKTLEEPPPHAKFLLATTDPQCLPVTVLSRCLQFHLKNLSPAHITQQLQLILEAEQYRYEPAALACLAQAAQGSMRDALSLMDQAIAYTNGQLTAQEVRILLGATAPELLISLLNHLVNGSAAAMLADVHTLAETGVDFQQVLEALLSLLHQITLAQMIPDLPPELHPNSEKILELARALTAETVQLYYQIALIGRRDLPLAPTPRCGFEMVLLRMLAFTPQTISIQDFLTPSKKQVAIQAEKVQQSTVVEPAEIKEKNIAAISTGVNSTESEDWGTLLAHLNLQGAAFIVASHCTLIQQTPTRIELALDPQHGFLLNQTIEAQINKALAHYFQKPIQLRIVVGEKNQETPASLDKKDKAEKQAQGAASLAADVNLQALMNQFEGKII
jgi:DNA polymerase-3 subunit gamma/tau